MARIVMLRHKESGIIKKGFIGFSWTTAFFGTFPALFRGDFICFIGGFVVLVILGVMTAGIGSGIAMFIWAFFYNSWYTKRLLERGYVLNDTDQMNQEARFRLRIAEG